MAAAHGNPILHHVRRLLTHRETGPSDCDLLRDFLDRRDEAAFAALVERHGAMVLGVCQSILRHRQDAEDAFQATFVVLARNAGSIRRRDGLGSWLHGVAHRVACKARAAGARRQALLAKAAVPPPVCPADDLTWGEVRSILHAELAALPERFREPLVLCYLEGLTQDEAARRLGWSATTVKGRLQRGRQALRRRLERRGLGSTAVLGTAVLAGQGWAEPVAPGLVQVAVRAALSVPGASAVALARGIVGPVAPLKVRLMATVLLATFVLAGGAMLLGHRPSAAESRPLAIDPPAAANDRPPAADRHGDPLPAGAVARLGTLRFNHGQDLNALHFTPDGKTILSEGGGVLRFWDAATGKELRHLNLPAPSFDDQTVLSADGKTMTFLNQDGFEHDSVRVWDLDRGKELRKVLLGGRRTEISVYRRNALSPDGKLCAVHGPQKVQVYDLATGRELCQLRPGPDEVAAVVFAGGDRVVTADKKELVQVWDARTGRLVRQFAHGGPVQVLAASPDGRRLATLEHHTHAVDRLPDRDLVHVWDLTTGKKLHDLAARPKHWYMLMRFSPDGKRLFTTSSGQDGQQFTVWDIETGRRVRDLKDIAGMALAVSPDGSRLAEGSSYGKFELWELAPGRRLSPQSGLHARSADAFFAPAGDRIVTLGYSSINTWDATTGRHLHSFDLPHYSYTLPHRVHSPDGRYAVSFAGDGEHQLDLLVWDVAAGRRLHTFRPPGASSYVMTAFSPDSARLAACVPAETGRVHVWDLKTGREVRTFPETQAGWPGRLFFAADGQTLFVLGRRTVGYNLGTGKPAFSWRMMPLPSRSGEIAVGGVPVTDDQRIAWRVASVSPDGRLFACLLGGGGFDRSRQKNRIALCDARTGQVLRRWGDSGLPSRSWEQLAFSPDGRLLASSDGSVIHLWEVATDKEVCTFRGHRGEVETLAFRADGRRLVSGSYDSTSLIWDVVPALGKPGPVEDVAGAWADLAGDDVRRAQAAVWRLADTPEAAVPFLRQRLRPDTVADLARVRQNVRDLDHERFTVRDKAFHALERCGPAAIPALRAALEKKPSLETRRRLEQLLEAVNGRPLKGEPLRTIRALTVLEHAGTPEARRLLRELAEGDPDGWLTAEAKVAWGRLGPASR
jgi:RNA polymerase sigma factor (sigma-70 family)